MSPRKGSARQSNVPAPPSSTRFVRRRRSARRRKPNQVNAGAQRPIQPDLPPEHVEPAPEAQEVPLSLGPRTVEPPPRNPNVFSFTYTVWKGS